MCDYLPSLGDKSHGEPGGEQGGRARQGSQESGDLKSREYRDAEGNVHHHAHIHQKQPGGQGGSGR
jgi:hypothetical protein